MPGESRTYYIRPDDAFRPGALYDGSAVTRGEAKGMHWRCYISE